jgi:hypothetical protein
MRVRSGTVIACLLGLAGVALGQSSVSPYDVAYTGHDADLSTRPALGIGSTYAVILGSHRMMLYDKATTVTPTNWLDNQTWSSTSYTNYPFQPNYSGTLYGAWLTFPLADYDPKTNSVWMMYSESNDFASTPRPFPEETVRDCDVQVLHVATTAENASVTTFLDCTSTSPSPSPANNCWNYLTGANAIDAGAAGINPYFEGVGPHNPFYGPPRYISLGFDERAVMVAGVDPVDCAGLNDLRGQCLLILEREFDNMGIPTSYHQGGIPAPTDMTMVRFNDLPYPDSVIHALAVQEPYDHEKTTPEFDNMTLFISTDGSAYAAGTPGTIDGLRLRGVYWDSANARWTVRQALEIDDPLIPSYKLTDIPLNTPYTSAVFGSGDAYSPELPDDSKLMVDNEAITSAVLAEDWLGNNRVFAVHASPVGIGEPGTQWVVQWYVIDPDLGNFYSATPDQWTPTLIEQGRIFTDGASEPTEGDCYLPTIGVSRCGQVFVEYTFSNGSTYPQIRRATLNYDYDAVVSTALVQAGPTVGYRDTPDRWALNPDMQVDPVSARFWSAHTLVGGANTRDLWLAKKSYNCFQTDMNRDGDVDALDLALYSDYYERGDLRADTDADDVVDGVDMLNFVAAYDAATGP